jgi:hypothetical protein
MTEKQAIAHARQYSKYWMLPRAQSNMLQVLYMFPEAEQRLQMAIDLVSDVMKDINKMTPKTTFITPKRKMCSLWPTEEIKDGTFCGVCRAGSEVGDPGCTAEEEMKCPWGKEAK